MCKIVKFIWQSRMLAVQATFVTCQPNLFSYICHICVQCPLLHG